MGAIGAVAIGRNEGERLQLCLRSLVGRAAPVVYVDSGSQDDSVARARALGVVVVELPAAVPFTAGRARNAGFERLLELDPGLDAVQFVDGDCELADGWLERAARALDPHPDVAVVCGRRRERFPDASLWNRLCDLEWDTPVGEATACGGDALVRVKAFRDVGGFASDMIAGEEPELCVRLRLAGWRILRIDAEMTLHDAAMTRFAQWWTRMRRAGHAYAEGAFRHGRSPLRHNLRELASTLFWGGLVPSALLASALLAIWWPPAALVAIASGLGLLLLYRRIAAYRRARGDAPDTAALYARFTVLGKLPLAWGALACAFGRLRRRRPTLIEYK